MKVPVVIMRGGTSKGVFLNHAHMPKNESLWEPFLLDVMGSPDQRQIDGLGGANSLTSKAAIIKKADSPDFDVEYTFAQVSIDQQMVDFKGNCGNISAAVGPYAIEQGLVPPQEPITTVRIWNTNTKKLIVAEVEVENGRVKVEGQCAIPGVPGTGSPIYLSFAQAEGAVTGKLFPTGNPIDMIKANGRLIPVSIVDVANPLVFVRAKDIGLTGTELPADFTASKLQELEEIRSIAAEMCKFADRKEATLKSPAVPKLTIVAAPTDYTDLTGTCRKAADMDLSIRMMSMQKPHQALAITGAICTTAAAFLPDTVLSELIDIKREVLRLAHPGGIIETKAEFVAGHISAIKVVRTARMILEGYVYTKSHYALAAQSQLA
ncbi:2-methylaconitate cis-trans isomerase PrpF family protein [Brevibacillus agri]|uniref:2-methylaconitate cis-trans isomerase PrpF family protein n=1 Tax=Brevibacillus agri TaxID=51101 RepID=UPI001EE51DFA|nr:PrpF domain-containing protein [Brevibacillus agri]MCG5252834.1 3-methylitaconate isomerase [Brevibacillus agri]